MKRQRSFAGSHGAAGRGHWAWKHWCCLAMRRQFRDVQADDESTESKWRSLTDEVYSRAGQRARWLCERDRTARRVNCTDLAVFLARPIQRLGRAGAEGRLLQLTRDLSKMKLALLEQSVTQPAPGPRALRCASAGTCYDNIVLGPIRVALRSGVASLEPSMEFSAATPSNAAAAIDTAMRPYDRLAR